MSQTVPRATRSSQARGSGKAALWLRASAEPRQRLVVRGPTVAGEHPVDASLVEGPGRRPAEAVASLAAGDLGDDLDAEVLEKAGEDRRRGHPVDVVVAEHADSPAALARRRQQLDGLFVAGHARRSRQIAQPRLEPAELLVEALVATADEQLDNRGMNLELARPIAQLPGLPAMQRAAQAHPRHVAETRQRGGLGGSFGDRLGCAGHRPITDRVGSAAWGTTPAATSLALATGAVAVLDAG